MHKMLTIGNDTFCQLILIIIIMGCVNTKKGMEKPTAGTKVIEHRPPLQINDKPQQ